MLYISKIDDYLEILTDEEVKDFVVINFSESLRQQEILALYLSNQHLMK